MKPAMARLMYEITVTVRESDERIADLKELNARFDAESSADRERVRNAASRLCATGNLRRVGNAYAYVSDVSPEPPHVKDLFPHRNPPPAKRPEYRKEKGHAASIEALRLSLRRQPSEPPPAPGPMPVTRGQSIADWILGKLQSVGSDLKVSAIVTEALKEGVSVSGNSVRQCLYQLVKDGRVERPARGVYRAPKEGVA